MGTLTCPIPVTALLLKPRSWIAPYVALWIGVGLLPFQPTDLDIFFWPSAKIAVHGHPFSVYAAGGHALYPNANGPVSLLPLSVLGVLLNAVGWLDATVPRRGIALGVFCLFVLLMAREAVAAIDRLVHHSTIFELNVESYRRKKAASDKQARRDSQKEKDQRPRQTAATQ